MTKWYPDLLLSPGLQSAHEIHLKDDSDVENNKQWLGVEFAEYATPREGGERSRKKAHHRPSSCCLSFARSILINGLSVHSNLCRKCTGGNGRYVSRCGWGRVVSAAIRQAMSTCSSLLGKNSLQMAKLPFRCFVSSIIISVVYVVIFTTFYYEQRASVDPSSPMRQQFPWQLILANIVGQLLMWSSFLVTYFTTPSDMPTICRDRYGQSLRAVVASYGCTYSTRTPSEASPVRSLGANKSASDTKPSVRVCHRCRLQLPLRAGHCKELDRCVLTYDHFCYFIWSCIHRGNYLYFSLYLIAMNMYIPLFLYSSRLYLKLANTESKVLAYFMLWCFFQWLFVVSLLYHHIQSLSVGMTIRERIKSPDYLSPVNPFCRGSLLSNIMQYKHEMRYSDLSNNLSGDYRMKEGNIYFSQEEAVSALMT